MSSSMSKHTLHDLFQRAIHIEYRAGKIYAQLAKRFSFSPEVSALWKGLMRDEAMHARVLRGIRDVISEDQRTSPCDQAMWDHVVAIQEFLDADPAESIENLEDAYQLAHEIEYSEINAVFRFLASDVIPSAKRSEFVKRHLDEHEGKLESFGEAFGDSESRRLIAVR